MTDIGKYSHSYSALCYIYTIMHCIVYLYISSMCIDTTMEQTPQTEMFNSALGDMLPPERQETLLNYLLQNPTSSWIQKRLDVNTFMRDEMQIEQSLRLDILEILYTYNIETDSTLISAVSR